MLVLSRLKDQKIIIGDGTVTVTVLEIRSGVVRLGIDADPGIPLFRGEVFERIEAEAVKREWESLTTDLGGSHG